MSDSSEDVKQGGDEWKQARVGKVTASRVDDVMATTKSGPAASRANYMAEVLSERLTDDPYPQFVSGDMRRGTEVEPEARTSFEVETGIMVRPVGFVPHPVIPMFGASPDGLIGDEGLLELKCPKTATHLKYLLAGVPPPEYVPQMTAQCSCTGRPFVWFASYDPRLPEDLKLFIVKFTPTQAQIAHMESTVKAFLAELSELEARVRGIRKS